MHTIRTVYAGAIMSALVAACEGSCKAFNGSFSIENYKLYPENSDFDPIGCKLYASANFNASVLVYDPYTATYEILTFDNITDVWPYHISGIDYDAASYSMFFSANSGTPFESSGANLTGPNKIIRYDLQTKSVAYIADLESFQNDYLKAHGRVVNGFQDFAEDSEGNTYVPIVFNGTGIAKISTTGDVSTFYSSNTYPDQSGSSLYSYVGILSLASKNKLIISDQTTGDFVSFETNSSSPAPQKIEISNMPSNYTVIACDGMITPSRYPDQQVILCSEDGYNNGEGSITVFTSSDNWVTGKFAGMVINNDALSTGSTPTATVQIANSIFINEMYFYDTGVYDIVGERSSFPFIDITSKVDAIVAADGISPVEE